MMKPIYSSLFPPPEAVNPAYPRPSPGLLSGASSAQGQRGGERVLSEQSAASSQAQEPHQATHAA